MTDDGDEPYFAFSSLLPAELSAPAPDADGSPPSSEVASARFDGEDFLFHLYRGSEFLQDNCVEEAKEELERALRLQPLDIEGQGLLGVVYFRLGLYPRAIEIYREIIQACPEEITPKLNLSLCYLKTGQPSEARDLLEHVISRSPEHRRAWGYLGLAFQRLGEYQRAQVAFDRAGQPHLSRRMQQLQDDLSHAPAEAALPREELRRAAANALAELDAGEDGAPFEQAQPEPEGVALRAGPWHAYEPGHEPVPPIGFSRRPSFTQRDSAVPAPLEATPTARAGAYAAGTRTTPALSPDALLSARWIDTDSSQAQRLEQGLVLIPVRESFAARTDRVRALLPQGQDFQSAPLNRRVRGRGTAEPFAGGSGTHWIVLDGRGALLLGGPTDAQLILLQLSGQFVYLRETKLVGFDGTVRHENGRLPAADPGPIPMVQLAGEGLVVFEARPGLGALAVSSERPLTVRSASVLGWTGRLLGQAVLGDRAARLGSGLVVFSGDGAVLVDDP